MGTQSSDRNSVEESVRRCYSTWSEEYYADYYQSQEAYPPVHTEIVRDHLSSPGIRTLLDAGCGPASMLRDLDGLELDRYGFDLTPEMISEARRVMAEQGVPAKNIWQGSVMEKDDFRAPSDAEGYDAAICFGVLPHIPANADAAVFENLTSAVRPGGLVMVEARNQLFALFTLNRYSREFFMKELIDLASLRKRVEPEEREPLDKAVELIDAQFRLDLPPIRGGKADEPGYDEVLSRTHNPFELTAVAKKAGLRDVSLLFYHYHCLPPMAESLVPKLFRRASLALEDPADWRGHFLASAYIVAGYRREE